MERHVREHLDELIDSVRNCKAEYLLSQSAGILSGYCMGLMHAGIIDIAEWGALVSMRENMVREWKENNK